jgi:hypothetical protein
MNRTNLIRTCAVGITCAAVGVGAGILDPASGATASGKAKAGAKAGARGLQRAVHADAVVPVAGGGFAAATLDRGFVSSVSGNDLTVREGTRKATYKTVTLSIPAGATIRLDRKPAQLADLRAGDRVRVLHGPKRTRVAAFDAKSAAAATTH